ncbi:ecto-ADP-ribosyltransferase 4-like [Notolabrus celidotus]|uniref:ecto-ADP-ribosyltransferase 4-like n=1 Tax=Notolabrus celidotus TaxID=1203425 RepID=UPI0014908172|nr:ecto-ADP-ribosyltransferase 4-like [Notolabrus celidotus]
MTPRTVKARQREDSPACVIASLVLLVALLMFGVIFVRLWLQNILEEPSVQDPALDPPDSMHDDCSSTAAVVTEEEILQKWDSDKNFSQAWSDAEREARAPAHVYMEKHHSIAVYMFTSVTLQPHKRRRKSSGRTGEQEKETFESRSLYSALSEAVQILRHSQVTCLSTTYTSNTLSSQHISDKLIRFSSFILGSDWLNSTGNTSCFEVYTCFGANVTLYSALKQSSQVLIPPYEVFKVTDIQTNTQECKVLYKLKSNLDCVYDREREKLHPISAFSEGRFWLIFIITCIFIVSLLLICVAVKVLKNCKRKDDYRAACMHDYIFYPGSVNMM